MKNKVECLFIGLAVLASVHEAAAQTFRFFRIEGPTATTITIFNPDGTMVWSNAMSGTNYIVQTSSSLTGDWKDYVQLPVTNSVNTNLIFSFNPPAGMVLIPAGVFTIGDTLDGEKDAIPTNVYVSAFYMDVNLVTSNQWAGIYNYATNNGYGFSVSGNGRNANCPETTMDWFDCVKWSNARSQQASLTPVYYTDAGLTLVYTNDLVYPEKNTVYANWAVNGYRLPTEAEWEKAARGGLIGQRFPWGDLISETNANYHVGSNEPYDLGGKQIYSNMTSPVGFFPPNGYGLYDMAGNAGEWCWDWSAAAPYPTGSAYLGGTDPRGPVGPLSTRVLRSGAYEVFANFVRCAYRQHSFPNWTGVNGLRCVRGL